MDRLLYSIEEAGHLLSLGRRQVERLLSSGELRFVRQGRYRRIPHEALTGYVSKLDGKRPVA